MYTSVIGRRFLDIYNRDRNKKLSAQELFEKEIFATFYNHKKYFKWVVNSPFVQKLPDKERKGIKTFEDEQKRKLENLNNKIEEDVPDSSFAIGFPAANDFFDTSGQVSSLTLPMDKESIYSSWIGAGFGIEVEGKQVWYLNNEKLLWTIYSGWSEYRKHLNSKVLDLKPNEIDLWNSVWLDHTFNKDKIVKKFLLDEYVEKETSEKRKANYALKQQTWIKMLFLLSSIFPKENLTVFSSRYIYDKQKYVTLGFINLNLPEVNKFWEFYNKIFKKSDSVGIKQMVALYETQYHFSRACEQGTIGLKAIEPKDLWKYMPGRSSSSEMPKYKNDEKNKINYSIYTTWVVAMLNNKDLLDLAEKAAEMLHDYESRERQARTIRSNKVDMFLNSKSRRGFVNSLTDIVKDDATISDMCNSLVNAVMIEISMENVYLFVTLLRFKYSIPRQLR
jgi:hypothetical protein